MSDCFLTTLVPNHVAEIKSSWIFVCFELRFARKCFDGITHIGIEIIMELSSRFETKSKIMTHASAGSQPNQSFPLAYPHQ
jgi:hypothetical protein